MSDPSLYATRYAQLRDCAELIDNVILDLESAKDTDGNEQRKALSSLLRTVDTAPASDASAVLLWNVLRENKAQPRVEWDKVANAIDRGDASGGIIGCLEELAHFLEMERAEMNARMRGSNAR